MLRLRDFVWCYNSVILPNYAKDDCEIIQFLLKTIWTRTRYEAKKCGKKQGESQSVHWHILHSSSCPIHVQFMSTCFRLCWNRYYFYAKSKSEDFSEKKMKMAGGAMAIWMSTINGVSVQTPESEHRAVLVCNGHKKGGSGDDRCDISLCGPGNKSPVHGHIWNVYIQ